MIQSTSVLLADEMGLGKTPQALSAAEALFSQQSIRRVLVVCPTSLLINWKREAQTWAPNLPGVLYRGGDRHGLLRSNAKLLIASYETITRDLWDESNAGNHYVDIGIDLLIIDEAQRIKNSDSKVSKLFKKLCSPRRWALTGTPLENHPVEMGSILGFLRPNESELLARKAELPELLRNRDQLMLRRTKEEVALELPEKTVGYIHVEMSAEQRSEYEGLLAPIRDRARDGSLFQETTANLLAILNNLRLVSASASSGSSGKLDYIEELFESLLAGSTKAIVFTSFPNKLFPHLINKFERFGIAQYHGDMSLEERDENHQSFVNDPNIKVMLASVKAAGTGLTWANASFVVHMDLWWNPQVLNQAEARAHRIGQTHPVICQRLVCESSIDEGIGQLLLRKERIFNSIVDEAQSEESHNDKSMLFELIENACKHI